MSSTTTTASRTLLIAAAFCALSTSVHAAAITWQAPVNTIDGSETLNTGATVQALNFAPNGAGTIVVNGVTFENHDSAQAPVDNTNGVAFSPFTAGEGDFHTLLNNLDSDVEANVGRVTYNAGTGLLTPGQDYAIQIWFTDDRNIAGVPGRVMRYDDGNAANFADLIASGSSQVAGDNEHGQNVVGTFTADDTFQTIGMTPVGASFPRIHITALQIRTVESAAIPAPLALPAGLAAFALIAARRRRR